MNGRAYDPLLARFASADPMTENPFSTQGWNRYSYVGNSPVNFTDPSGYCFMGCFWRPIFRAIQNLFRNVPILGTIVQIAAGVLCAGPLAPVCVGIAAAVVTGISGGNLGQALRAGFVSAVTAFAFFQVGELTSGGFQFGSERHILNMAGHALVGCGSAVASGGKCGPGALSGAIGSFAGPLLSNLNVGAQLVATSVLGGLASVAGGGKFANGAVTAAFGYLFSPTGLERSGELRDTNYAVTYIDFWGNVRTDYLPAYKYLDPISQEAVRIHEGVHVEQLRAVTWEGLPFWGGFGNHRATWNGTPALEAPAFRVQLDFLNRTLDAVPRSDWTVDHRSADLFRQQVQSNLWRAEQYLREGRRF